MFACASDGYVEFAVDELAVELDGSTEEGELLGGADCGGVDDDVALRALIALHGVDVDCGYEVLRF